MRLTWVLRSTMLAVYQQRKEVHPVEQAWVLRKKSLREKVKVTVTNTQKNMGNQEMGYTQKQKNQ